MQEIIIYIIKKKNYWLNFHNIIVGMIWSFTTGVISCIPYSIDQVCFEKQLQVFHSKNSVLLWSKQIKKIETLQSELQKYINSTWSTDWESVWISKNYARDWLHLATRVICYIPYSIDQVCFNKTTLLLI